MPDNMETPARSIMSATQWQEFQEKIILALSYSKLTRVRVNLFLQRGSIGIVGGKIDVEIASLNELGLPPLPIYHHDTGGTPPYCWRDWIRKIDNLGGHD